MRPPPETDAKRHHHIPASYMRRFSPDRKHVFAFDRVTQRTRRDIPENVAVEGEFNTVVTYEGKKERWAEAVLGELDGLAKPLLDKLERREALSREERWYVAFFVGFADTRGGGFREEIHTTGYHAWLEAQLNLKSSLIEEDEGVA